MKPHEKLIGKSREELRDLAPSATHQHRKGGLYRDMGIPTDADTGAPFSDHRGQMRAWQHVHPYDEQLFLRPVSEDDRFTDLR